MTDVVRFLARFAAGGALSLAVSFTGTTALAQAPEPGAVPTPAEAASAEIERVPETPEAPPPFSVVTPNGLTADEAARRAVETAPAVRRAEASRAAAEAARDRAASAFAPRFDFTGSYTRINEVDLPPFEIPGLPPTENPFPQILDLWGLRGTVAIPLSDYFFTIWPAYEGAEGFARAANAQTEVAENDTAFRAREAFYGLVRARAAGWVAAESVRSLEAALADVESLMAAGTASRADVLSIRASLASARAGVVQTEGGARVAERSLQRLMHTDASAPLAIGEDVFAEDVGQPWTEEALLAAARDNRAELRALRTIVTAREHLVRAQLGTTLPRLALTGQLDTSSPNQRVIPQTTDIYTTWAVGAAVSWSPNDLAEGVHRVREAEAQLAEAREDLAQLEDGIAIEVAQAVAAQRSAIESIVAAREAASAAATALEDRRAMLAAGVATTTELLTAQLEHTRAQLQLLDAAVSVRLAGAQTARVAGRAVLSGGAVASPSPHR